MNYIISQGFQPRLLCKREIKQVRDRLKTVIRKWRTQKIKVMFAYINALTYRACRYSGVLEQVRKAKVGGRKGFHKFIGNIQAIALRGIGQFTLTIEGAVDQLANLWGLIVSEASLRKYRYELQDEFELFHFESKPIPLGQKGNKNARKSPMLKDFDLSLACILLETLEDILVKERGCEIEEFPGAAAMCRFIYNTLFKGICSYRRQKIALNHAVLWDGIRWIYEQEFDWSDAEWTQDGLRRWLGTSGIDDEPIPT